MNWDDLRGHAIQVEMFRRSVQRHRLSHAYLFAGTAGIGKKRFATTLAKCLLCQQHSEDELLCCGTCSSCRQMDAGTHPDFLSVGLPPGKMILPISAFVGSDERRGREGLCYELSLRPMAGNRKIAVIDDADHMNEESANALLKTLEEPPEFALLILIASNPDAMLTTIRSRCQAVRFATLPHHDTVALLMENEIVSDPAEAEIIATLAEGSLDLAAQLSDPELRKLREVLYRGLSAARFDAISLYKNIMQGIENAAGDTAGQRRMARWLMRFALEFYRSALLVLTGEGPSAPESEVASFARRYAAQDPAAMNLVMDLLERTARAAGQLEQSIPVSLCLEGYFDDLGYLLRPRGTRATVGTRA